jgi:magnesium transporter
MRLLSGLARPAERERIENPNSRRAGRLRPRRLASPCYSNRTGGTLHVEGRRPSGDRDPERGTPIVQGLGREERDRITMLRSRGQFFWLDISLSETRLADLGKALDLPERALQPLNVRPAHPGSQKLYADGHYVVFPYSCYIESADVSGDTPYRTRSVEVHILISSNYMLTVHQERVSLPAVLAPYLPGGRTRQFVVYAVLEAMVDIAFDALDEIAAELDAIAMVSGDLRGGRVRMATLRRITARLARMRRGFGPHRTLFQRIGVEIEGLPGLETDDERYLDRLAEQADRLANAIESTSDTMATLVDLRLNETSYWLTVVATIFLPLTFVTGFFGMNFSWMTDQIDTELAFLLLGVGACVASVLVVWRFLVRTLPVEADRARQRR